MNEAKRWIGIDKNNRVTEFVTLYANDYDALAARCAELESFCSHHGILKAQEEHNALRDKCAELEENLLHYGAHMIACDFIQDTLKCSCGFEDIRKRLSATPSASRKALDELHQMDQEFNK